MAEDKAVDFDAVLAKEREKGFPKNEKTGGVGLAFSGGGIRSATFNLGVIQALCDRKLLQRFDYLSTISGGGYIGSWLSTFILRRADGDVAKAEPQLAAHVENRYTRRDPDGLELASIRFLRAYSNYLTPHSGLSRDTLVAVATYLRNFLLNLAILVTLLGAVLIAPRIAAQAAFAMPKLWAASDWVFDAVLAALLLLPTLSVGLGLFYEAPDAATPRRWFQRGRALALMLDAPMLLAALVATSYYLYASQRTVSPSQWAVSIVALYVGLWVAGLALATAILEQGTEVKRRLSMLDVYHAKWALTFVLIAGAAALVGSGIILGIEHAIRALPEAHRPWASVVLGPPAVLGAVMLMLVAHIGLMGRSFGESHRELWAVYGARLLALCGAWLVLTGIALYGPALLHWVDAWVAYLGGIAWVATTLFGVIAGRGSATGGRSSRWGVELLTRLAPYVFALGLLLVLSLGVHRALGGDGWDREPEPAAIFLRADPVPGAPVVTVRSAERRDAWQMFLDLGAQDLATVEAAFDPWWLLALLAALFATLAAGLSGCVNINVFSLHHFYRNRLTRCYLGATNPARKPNPLTGFDPDDDVALAALSEQRPLHIVGTAVNLNAGRQLAWQNRRAASFAFTPHFAGYQPASASFRGGFRPVAQYGLDDEGAPMMLGTAVAISGAAASPNAGYHTSPAVAFLLTVFNVRLGHWCGDPAQPVVWRQRDPDFGLRYWWAELTGSADVNLPFLNLSDGGHFENLGIYELVRRRCSVIVASDGSADPSYAFDDLAEAMRKCYTDFGVEIKFRGNGVDDIRPAQKGLPSVAHHAVADIIYPAPTPKGVLIYWKSSITAEMPPDIMHYQRTHQDFPHESTADQFFDESQFESYRHLGHEAATRALKSLSTGGAMPQQLQYE